MARNSLGREIPELWHGRRLDPYRDPWSRKPDVDRATRPLVRRNPARASCCRPSARPSRSASPATA